MHEFGGNRCPICKQFHVRQTSPTITYLDILHLPFTMSAFFLIVAKHPTLFSVPLSASLRFTALYFGRFLNHDKITIPGLWFQNLLWFKICFRYRKCMYRLVGQPLRSLTIKMNNFFCFQFTITNMTNYPPNIWYLESLEKIRLKILEFFSIFLSL